MLSLDKVNFAYKDSAVLHDINLEVRQGEVICILGESGSGKSTLLRLVAGLERNYQGLICFDGHDIYNVPVHERDFGLMFQDYALFPHMDVKANIAFGLNMKGVPSQQQPQMIHEVLQLVGLSGFEKRDVAQLSGGERQRVALARSLAPQPRLLMLDEPLGSLDAGLRERLVIELQAIFSRVGLTTIYVTHDQQEAFAVADRIAIMNNGQIEQIDTPETLHRFPHTSYVARFLGLQNIIPPGTLSGLIAADTLNAELILIHPDGISIQDDGQLQGTVIGRIFQGSYYKLAVKVGEVTFLVRAWSQSQVPQINTTISLVVDPAFIVPLHNTG